MIQPITIGRATIYHADCLVALAQLLNQLSTAGAPIFPEDGTLLDWVYERAGLPKRSPETVAMAEVAQQANQAGLFPRLTRGGVGGGQSGNRPALGNDPPPGVA